MSDWFFDMAQKQYENALPDRYTRKPRYECDNCGEGIFSGDEYVEIGDGRYCEECIKRYTYTAEEEEWE